MMKFGSLFAGIGGFDLGFERAGMQVAWQCEIEPFCQKILKQNWPDVPLYPDIKDFPSQVPTVDLICGGFPCQDLSVAGKRKGLAGERSGLFYDAISVISRLVPKWVVIENVVGLLSSNNGKDFAIVQYELERRGYGLAWRVFDSQYFGLAQRRKRVFIVGYFGGKCPPQVLFEPEGSSGNFTPRKKRKDNSTKLSNRGPYPKLESNTVGAKRFSNEWAKNGHAIFEENTRNELRVRGSKPTVNNWGGKQKPWIIQETANPIKCKSFTGKPAADNYICQAFDSDGVRKATGFPRRMDTPDSPRYKALGNAVSVDVAEWLGRRIAVAYVR